MKKRYYVAEADAVETPQARAAARGVGALSNAELLSLFLRSNGDRTARARTILAAKPLDQVLALTPQDPEPLTRTEVVTLQAALEIGTRLQAISLTRGDSMNNPTLAGEYFKAKLYGRPNEVFAAMFLDTRHRVIAYEELFQGCIDGAEVHPGVVVRRALLHNAAAMVVGHNHPSGSAEPSAADRAVTARLKQALALVGIRLLDHFVVADGPAVSLAARGWV